MVLPNNSFMGIIQTIQGRKDTVIQYDASFRPLFQGWAEPGTLISDSKWAIIQYSYSSNVQIGGRWANGRKDEILVWDDRATYTFQPLT